MKCNFFHKTYRTLFSTFYRTPYRTQNIKFRQKLVKLQDLVVTTYTAENDTTAVSRYCFVKFHMFISSPADGLFHEPLCISLVINFSISCKPVKKKKKEGETKISKHSCMCNSGHYILDTNTYILYTYVCPAIKYERNALYNYVHIPTFVL